MLTQKKKKKEACITNDIGIREIAFVMFTGGALSRLGITV